jgi:uncharacterized protein YjbI with pentapeptide repeats
MNSNSYISVVPSTSLNSDVCDINKFHYINATQFAEYTNLITGDNSDNKKQATNCIITDLLNDDINSKFFGFTQPNIINHTLIQYGLYKDLTNIINQYLLGDNFVNWDDEQIYTFFNTQCNLSNELQSVKIIIKNLNISNINIDNCIITNVDFYTCRMNHSSLKNCEFKNCSFNACEINNANFSNSTFVNTDFNSTDAFISKFINTNMSGCYIRNSTFYCANIKNTHFYNTIFDNHTDLTNSNLTGVTGLTLLCSNSFWSDGLPIDIKVSYINYNSRFCNSYDVFYNNEDLYYRTIKYKNLCKLVK